MARLIRCLLTALLLLAVMAGGTGAFAGGKGGRSHHTCDAMAVNMAMDDCPDSHDSVPPACSVFVCGAQIGPPSTETFFVPIVQTRAFAPLLRDDSVMGGILGSPDLRPPIL